MQRAISDLFNSGKCLSDRKVYNILSDINIVYNEREGSDDAKLTEVIYPPCMRHLKQLKDQAA